MKIVLDVSAAFGVITGGHSAEKMLIQLKAASQVLAPDLYFSEATNAAWKFHHIENISIEESYQLAKRAIQLIDVFVPSESLWKEALELACQQSHPAYDCYYLVLAKRLDATLLTNDKRLIKVAEKLDLSLGTP